MQRVKNLDDYGNKVVQDYYLAFTVAMCNFNVNYLKSSDLEKLASECELVLPMVRVRTSHINKLPEEKKMELREQLIIINRSNRSKEYVKRLLDELYAHAQVLWDDEKDIAIYTFMEMLRIKCSMRTLATHINSMAAFHKITKRCSNL